LIYTSWGYKLHILNGVHRGEASRARLLRLLVKVRRPDRLASESDHTHRGPARRRTTGPKALRPMRPPARLDNKPLASIQGQVAPAAGSPASEPGARALAQAR
jgi:hypothetical protein